MADRQSDMDARVERAADALDDYFGAGMEPAARDALTAAGLPDLLAERDQLRGALAEADEAMRRVTSTCIALSDKLDTPYPDDPRWTPWTRFMARALQRVERARTCARTALQASDEESDTDAD